MSQRVSNCAAVLTGVRNSYFRRWTSSDLRMKATEWLVKGTWSNNRGSMQKRPNFMAQYLQSTHQLRVLKIHNITVTSLLHIWGWQGLIRVYTQSCLLYTQYNLYRDTVGIGPRAAAGVWTYTDSTHSSLVSNYILFILNTFEPGYNDIGLCDTSPTASQIFCGNN
jgi:hypothetical protein